MVDVVDTLSSRWSECANTFHSVSRVCRTRVYGFRNLSLGKREAEDDESWCIEDYKFFSARISAITKLCFRNFAIEGPSFVEGWKIFQKVWPMRRRIVGMFGVQRDRSRLVGGEERVIGTARRFFRGGSEKRAQVESREGRKSPGSDGEKVGPKRKPHFRLYALPRNSRISLIIRGTWAKVARVWASFLPWLARVPLFAGVTREGF